MVILRRKRCCRCAKNRLIKEFGKRSCAPDGLKYWCKECDSEAGKKFYKENRDKVLNSCKIRYKNNSERYLAQQNKYRKENPQKRKSTLRRFTANKRKANPMYKLEVTLRNRINLVTRYRGKKKPIKTMELIGCTIEECRAHIESLFKPGMSWSNHGQWHIDHKLPIASFDLTDLEQQKICFNYTNLQPLWAAENRSKGAKIT